MSWMQLQALIRENREGAQREAADPPVACPIDGALLDIRADGTRNCPAGNFRWDGGPVILAT